MFAYRVPYLIFSDPLHKIHCLFFIWPHQKILASSQSHQIGKNI